MRKRDGKEARNTFCFEHPRGIMRERKISVPIKRRSAIAIKR